MPEAILSSRERTVPGLLRRAAAEYGDRPLMSIAGASWTHRDAAAAAAKRGAALRAAGVARGDRVALMCSNGIEQLEVFLGCGWIGAIAVPINTASMGPQIQYYVENSGARLLVIEAQFVERIAGLRIDALWVVDEGYPQGGEAIEPVDVLPGEALAILYTSGTTGPAKGVTCPHAHYYWWGLNTAEILGVRRDDVLSTTLPLFHINALNTFAQAALTGCRVTFEPRFSASQFWERSQEATVIYLLGAMVPILLAQPPRPAERQHRARIGLGPGVPAAALRAFRERTGVALVEGYGSTETNFVIATPPERNRGGIMGWLRPGFDARVVDEHDAEVPAGQAGELVLRADEPFAFASGYFGMPRETVEAWRNLWFHTGDRVMREADGAFKFIDRIKDAIRRRGENVSSYEVEQVLLLHPAVAAAAVFPVRSELAEDEVMAAVIGHAGQEVSAAELAKFCETRLPYFAIPRYIDVVNDLPRTENGKVQKFKLRERGVTASTWDGGNMKATRRP